MRDKKVGRPNTQNTKTHFTSGVDVRVEPTSSSIGRDTLDLGSFDWVSVRELQFEFKEAKLVRGIRRTDDKCSDISDIILTKGDGKCYGQSEGHTDVGVLNPASLTQIRSLLEICDFLNNVRKHGLQIVGRLHTRVIRRVDELAILYVVKGWVLAMPRI